MDRGRHPSFPSWCDWDRSHPANSLEYNKQWVDECIHPSFHLCCRPTQEVLPHLTAFHFIQSISCSSRWLFLRLRPRTGIASGLLACWLLILALPCFETAPRKIGLASQLSDADSDFLVEDGRLQPNYLSVAQTSSPSAAPQVAGYRDGKGKPRRPRSGAALSSATAHPPRESALDVDLENEEGHE